GLARQRQTIVVYMGASIAARIAARLIAGGMDPAEVGRIVAEAVKERRFYVLPHRWENMVEARTRNIVEGRDPTLETLPGIPD
ncbi:MAG: hypothetical protein GY946_15660, partial [bacterium]|nr:hypothetical protein [bacterium]